MKSILNTKKGFCYICKANGYTEVHHIFYGGLGLNRKLSEKYGLKVDLCHECHRNGKEAVHETLKHRIPLYEEGQRKFEEVHGSREDFKRIFGRNYL